MSDDLVKRMQELRSNQYADPSTAPEFVFIDPDLPPSEWEKQYSMDVVYVRADRIEQLVAINEAMTEQLKAARADAKEAEAYAEGLERDLKTCCMAQTVMDNTVAELERERDEWKASWQEVLTAGYEIKAKLAKAVEGLRSIAANTCCTPCQEAALVARTTLAELESSPPYGLEGEKG